MHVEIGFRCFGDGGFIQIFEIVSKVCEHECRVLAALMVVKFGMGWQQGKVSQDRFEMLDYGEIP